MVGEERDTHREEPRGLRVELNPEPADLMGRRVRRVITQGSLKRAKGATVIAGRDRSRGATQELRGLARGVAQSGLSRMGTLIIYVR